MPNETLKCLSGTRQDPDLPDGVNLLEDRTEKCLNKLPSCYYWPREQLSRIEQNLNVTLETKGETWPPLLIYPPRVCELGVVECNPRAMTPSWFVNTQDIPYICVCMCVCVCVSACAQGVASSKEKHRKRGRGGKSGREWRNLKLFGGRSRYV